MCEKVEIGTIPTLGWRTKMSEDIIWSGPVGPQGDQHASKVVRIGDSVFRGILSIMDEEGTVLYRKEVPIAHGSAFGADAQVSAGWTRVINEWYANYR